MSAAARVDCPRCRRNVAALPTSPSVPRQHKCDHGRQCPPTPPARGCMRCRRQHRRQLELFPAADAAH